MEMLIAIVFFAILNEWAVEQVKRIYLKLNLSDGVKEIISIVLGIAGGFGLAFGYKLDLIYAMGMSSEYTIGGAIMAGVAVAAGSSAIYKLVDKKAKAKDDIKVGGTE